MLHYFCMFGSSWVCGHIHSCTSNYCKKPCQIPLPSPPPVSHWFQLSWPLFLYGSEPLPGNYGSEKMLDKEQKVLWKVADCWFSACNLLLGMYLQPTQKQSGLVLVSCKFRSWTSKVLFSSNICNLHSAMKILCKAINLNSLWWH